MFQQIFNFLFHIHLIESVRMRSEKRNYYEPKHEMFPSRHFHVLARQAFVFPSFVGISDWFACKHSYVVSVNDFSLESNAYLLIGLLWYSFISITLSRFQHYRHSLMFRLQKFTVINRYHISSTDIFFVITRNAKPKILSETRISIICLHKHAYFQSFMGQNTTSSAINSNLIG